MTIASAFNEIAVAQGGTADNSGTIAGAVDALTDALAGSDQPAPQTIEQGVRMLGEHIGGGGGGVAVATGSFTPATAGATETFTTDYNGTGYPVIGVVYVDGGYANESNQKNTEWVMHATKNAIGLFTFCKYNTDTTPTYTGSTPVRNGLSCCAAYRSSDSVIFNMSAVNSSLTNTFNATGTPNGTSAMMTFIIRSANDFAYFARNSSYGFAVGVTYKYIIVYSE